MKKIIWISTFLLCALFACLAGYAIGEHEELMALRADEGCKIIEPIPKEVIEQQRKERIAYLCKTDQARCDILKSK